MEYDYNLAHYTVLCWTIKESKLGEPLWCSAELNYKNDLIQTKTFTGPSCKTEMNEWIVGRESIMIPPRYQTATVLNTAYLSPVTGGVFYSLDNAMSSVDTLVAQKICRSGTVTDKETGEVVHTAMMADHEPYHIVQNYF